MINAKLHALLLGWSGFTDPAMWSQLVAVAVTRLTLPTVHQGVSGDVAG